jgi:hypothetical protein
MYASAGILHIVTEQPKFISNKKHNFHGQIKGGSFGLFNSIARWEQQVGTNSAFTIDGINSLTVTIGIPKLITIIPNEGFPVQSSYIIRNLMND